MHMFSKTKMFDNRKGVSALVGTFVGLLVVVIIAVAVVIPTVQDTINQENFTGTLGTVMDVIPLLIAIAVILVIVGIYSLR